MYTIAGWTVETPEQVRSIMMMAVLKDDQRIVQQCMAVLAKMN